MHKVLVDPINWSLYVTYNLGPQPDWDPDIVATLDDDYEHCDLLEDDFVGVANGSPSDGNHDDRLNKWELIHTSQYAHHVSGNFDVVKTLMNSSSHAQDIKVPLILI